MASPPSAAKLGAATPPARAIALDAPNTDAGAMERLFVLEAYNPGNVGNYVAAENLAAMRLMRQTIENRLKSPGEYGAKGAKTETDIVELGNQFAGFGSYPEFDASMSANLAGILAIANNPRHPQKADYAQFVKDAVTAATETVVPPTAKFADVTAWRTADHGPPGGRFSSLETIGGNTFYATRPVPPMPPKHIKHSQPRAHPVKRKSL